MDRLFLDSEELELSGDTGIYLTYRSNIFSDITKIVGDNSATIHVPATNHNKAVIECSMIPSADSVYPYRTHTARLERDGVVMLKNATAVLMSVTPDTIELALTWGVTDALQAWVNSDTTLRDLQFGYLTWDDDTIANRPAYFPMANYGFAKTDTSVGMHPVEYIGSILAKIASDNGLTFVYGEDPWEDDKWVMPLLTRNDAEGAAKEWEMFGGYQDAADDTWAIGYLYANPGDFDTRWKKYFSLAYSSDDLYTAKDAEGVTTDAEDSAKMRSYWATELNNVKITITGTANVRVVSTSAVDAWATTLRIVGWNHTSLTNWTPTDVIANGDTLLSLTPDSQSAVFYSADNEWRYDMGFTFNNEELDLTKIETGMVYDRLFVVAESNNGAEIKHGHTLNGTISYTYLQDPIDYGRDFYIAPNLPDMKQIDFVKAIMQMSGLFAFLNSSGSITFAPYSILYDNKDYARDWSAYLLHNGSTIPKEMQYHQGDECQYNKMHYHNAEDFPDWSGEYTLDNQTLEYERDAVTLPFSAYKMTGGVATFPIYDYLWDDNNESDLEFNPNSDAHISVLDLAQTGRLPSEYQEVEYLQGNGYQYLDTGVMFEAGDEIECVLRPLSNSGDLCFFGCYQSNSRQKELGTLNGYFNFDNVTQSVYIYTAEKYKVKFSGGWYVDGELKASGVNNTNTSHSLILFGRWNGSAAEKIASARFFSYRHKRDGQMLCNLIPCKRIADSVYGMFDLVSSTFLENLGTGTFGGGSEKTYNVYQLKNTGLTWTELLAAHYTDYVGMLNHARVLTERFILPPMELKDIDLRKPIYLEQYGSYFAISTIKTRANNEAEVELIKMS